ncbi:aminopeptidase P family protein [Peptoniphilus catoniae]|uniref:aminopeptidase P family protein n=1 Tax=Peptoniphilus catoniae TaxID=1660341 RepID=UPI0010FE9924|nr:aminopeptidase P family protein [Peptoniphilus catoniae]
MILDDLRSKMKKLGLSAYIIPTLDPHGSEYLPEYYKERKFVTGFTGSAGTALITLDEAFLWTDGRYFIQAENEIKNFGFKLMKMGIEGYPTINEYLSNNLKDGSKIGLNANYYIEKDFEDLKNLLNSKNIIIEDVDLIYDLWKDRPALSDSKIFIHDIKYSGKSSEEKINEIRKILLEKEADLTILNSLDDIAWIFNIRARDIKNTPVVISYAIIEEDKAYLFVDNSKLDDKVKSYLEKFSIIREYDEIFEYVKLYKNKKIYVNDKKINRKLYASINESNIIVKGNDISASLKSIKNNVEIENQKNAYLKDGVALTKYIYWLKKKADIENLNEFEVSEKLYGLRKEQEGFLEGSFDTISAYGSNAAMMHYTASREKNSKLEPKGLYLVDSGGQYLDGTTDITRTISLGDLTEEEIKDFSYVLKSHLSLMDLVFLKGTKDIQLDSIARNPIWSIGYDYKCGTGHGVGYLLGVHETPPTVGPRSTVNEVKVGMIFSNEPGIYKEGKHGIRIENIVEVVETFKNESGTFLKLNTISLAPIDIDAIDVKYLTKEEIEKLNSYHKMVFEKLSPYLETEEKKWLKEVTKAIGE